MSNAALIAAAALALTPPATSNSFAIRDYRITEPNPFFEIDNGPGKHGGKKNPKTKAAKVRKSKRQAQRKARRNKR